jgi:AraC-like DNA-binding protein
VGSLGESFLDNFLLDQQLYRLLAALVFSSLRHPQPSPIPEPNAPSTDRRLARVLDFIVLNLDQPLSLSVLMEQSNYSRRSIHYAFKERFNCSPMQWIRQQRMTLAMQRLQEGQSGRTTVRAIAAECGYNSLGRFYVDFQRAYGCRPSVVLRGMASKPMNQGE